MEEFNQDKDIDLSPFSKDHLFRVDNYNLRHCENTFKLVKDHMRQHSSEGHKRKIISCYCGRAEDSTFICSPSEKMSCQLHNLFFPVWILLALIPEEEERSLTIENAVVVQLYKDKDEIPSYIAAKLCPLIGKGSLIIKRLTVVCLSKTLPIITNLIEQLKNLGNIRFEHVKLKVTIERDYDYSNLLEKLHAASKGSDDLKLMRDYITKGEKLQSMQTL